MFDCKSNKTADGLSCDVEPRLRSAVPHFRVPYVCAVLPHEKSTASPWPIFAKLVNAQQICYTEFHVHLTINVESTDRKFFKPQR
jgi:hypothetical protein